MEHLSFFITFNIVLFFLVILDFILINRDHSLKNAIRLSVAWIVLGISFSGVILWLYGEQHFYEYLSAYFIEKSLSVDNIFVFFLIFSSFNIAKEYQHKVLFVGIWTAIVLRLIMILLVGKMIESFHFVIYFFGGIILYAGIASLKQEKQTTNDYTRLLKYFKKFMNVFTGEHKGRFFVYKGKLYVTTLLIALLVIEVSDIVFAFDSVPALFSITDDKTIIYTSNILAIIGLRSLYGLLAEIIDRFAYMKYGVSCILIFVGLKMISSDFYTINARVSLCIIVGILSISIIASMRKKRIDDR